MSVAVCASVLAYQEVLLQRAAMPQLRHKWEEIVTRWSHSGFDSWVEAPMLQFSSWWCNATITRAVTTFILHRGCKGGWSEASLVHRSHAAFCSFFLGSFARTCFLEDACHWVLGLWRINRRVAQKRGTMMHVSLISSAAAEINSRWMAKMKRTVAPCLHQKKGALQQI